MQSVELMPMGEGNLDTERTRRGAEDGGKRQPASRTLLGLTLSEDAWNLQRGSSEVRQANLTLGNFFSSFMWTLTPKYINYFIQQTLQIH